MIRHLLATIRYGSGSYCKELGPEAHLFLAPERLTIRPPALNGLFSWALGLFLTVFIQIKNDPVWRLMAVGEHLDVDDHPFAHLDPAFDRGRRHMRQQNDIGQAQ